MRFSPVQMMRLSQRAWQECALLGQREIDLEHVLLATMDDPDVGEVLAGHGVTREGVRAAVEQSVREEVAGLGIDLEGMPLTERRRVAEVTGGSVGELDVSRRAQDVMASGRGFAEVLLRVLDEPGGTGVRLLESQGADVEEVRTQLAALVGTGGAGRTETRTGELPDLPDLHLLRGEGSGPVARRSTTWAVPAETVWPHVSTAEGILSWMSPDDTARAAGPTQIVATVEHRQGLRRRRATATITRSLLAAEPPVDGRPGHVLWQDRFTTRGRDWDGQWFHVTVTPTGTGTRVDLVHGLRMYGRLGRLLRGWAALMQRTFGGQDLYRLGLRVEEEA